MKDWQVWLGWIAAWSLIALGAGIAIGSFIRGRRERRDDVWGWD